jgi:hypothetical protein
MTNNSDDIIGYGSPPKRTQFKPGQSGNPSGRPKGIRNFRTELLDELAESITIKEGDKDVTVSKQRACIKTLVAAAIGGDTRACGALLGLCAKFRVDSEGDTEQLAAEDRDILDSFTARDRKRTGKCED